MMRLTIPTLAMSLLLVGCGGGSSDSTEPAPTPGTGADLNGSAGSSEAASGGAASEQPAGASAGETGAAGGSAGTAGEVELSDALELGFRVLTIELSQDESRALLCGRSTTGRHLAEVQLSPLELVRSQDLADGNGCSVAFDGDGVAWAAYGIEGGSKVQRWTENGLEDIPARDPSVPFGRWLDSQGRAIRLRRTDDGRFALVRDPGEGGERPTREELAGGALFGTSLVEAGRIQVLAHDGDVAILKLFENAPTPGGTPDRGQTRMYDFSADATFELPDFVDAGQFNGRVSVHGGSRRVCFSERTDLGTALHRFELNGSNHVMVDGLPVGTAFRCTLDSNGLVLFTTPQGLQTATFGG